MVVFVVSSGTNKNFTIFAPPTKILRFTLKNYNCTPPWIKFYQVRLKVDAIGSVSSVIDCNEVFLWLTHQKLDHSKHFWCNVRNWVGQLAPLPPPPWLRAWHQVRKYAYRMKQNMCNRCHILIHHHCRAYIYIMLLSLMPIEETGETRVRTACLNFYVSLCIQIFKISIRGRRHCIIFFVGFKSVCSSWLHNIA